MTRDGSLTEKSLEFHLVLEKYVSFYGWAMVLSIGYCSTFVFLFEISFWVRYKSSLRDRSKEKSTVHPYRSMRLYPLIFLHQ